jgi:hypothetical protein
VDLRLPPVFEAAKAGGLFCPYMAAIDNAPFIVHVVWYAQFALVQTKTFEFSSFCMVSSSPLKFWHSN